METKIDPRRPTSGHHVRRLRIGEEPASEPGKRPAGAGSGLRGASDTSRPPRGIQAPRSGVVDDRRWRWTAPGRTAGRRHDRRLFGAAQRDAMAYLPDLHTAAEDRPASPGSSGRRRRRRRGRGARRRLRRPRPRPGRASLRRPGPGGAGSAGAAAPRAGGPPGRPGPLGLPAQHRRGPVYERHGFGIAERTDGAGNKEREPDARMVWPGASGSATAGEERADRRRHADEYGRGTPRSLSRTSVPRCRRSSPRRPRRRRGRAGRLRQRQLRRLGRRAPGLSARSPAGGDLVEPIAPAEGGWFFQGAPLDLLRDAARVPPARAGDLSTSCSSARSPSSASSARRWTPTCATSPWPCRAIPSPASTPTSRRRRAAHDDDATVRPARVRPTSARELA